MQATKSKRVRRGVVYTPVDVTKAICQNVLKNMGAIHSVLEPSAGDGIFLGQLTSLSVDEDKITAIDISKVATKRLAKEFPKAKVLTTDFINYALAHNQIKYDLIIGNPPYVRRHNFTKQQQISIAALAKSEKYPLGQLKNSWAAFILASCRMLSAKGSLALIIPYEFMTVSYGKYLQEWILSNYGGLDIYVPDTKAFPDIDQDAILLVVSNKRVSRSKCTIHRVNSLSDLSAPVTTSFSVTDGKICPIDQNRFLIGNSAALLLSKLRDQLPLVSDICDSATGTVTAANDFFILSKQDVLNIGLENWASPILKKASHLTNSIRFTERDFDALSVNEPCYLINFGSSDLQSLPAQAQEYIAHGVVNGFNKRYKCRNRKPWYRVPETPSARGYFFKRSHLVPRLVINEANLQVTDTAYRLVIKPDYSLDGLCFSFYNSLTLLFAEIYGRFYGGGVLELTPNEFKQIPICYVKPTKLEFIDFEQALSDHLDKPNRVFNFGDDWLAERLQLKADELSLIQTSLERVRNHRLRHGSRLH